MLGLLKVVFFLSLTAVHCRRMLSRRQISVKSERFPYREVMDMNIGTCIDPDHPTILLNNNTMWQELVWNKMDKSSTLRTDGWGNNPWGQSWLPPHMMIGLVHNETKYPPEPPQHVNVDVHNDGLDSECFLMDYNKKNGPDPAGCRVFSKSFAPLKKLRNCIVGHLDQDPMWVSRETAHIIDERSNFSGSYNDWCKQAIWSYLAGGTIPVKLCSQVDSIRRAEEMIKFVLFKPLPSDSVTAAKKIREKIQFTTSWPKGQNSLTDATTSAIQEQCFEVHEGQSLEQAAFLQRIGICLPLMFDKAEIQGFGISDGIRKFQTSEYYGNEKQDLKNLTTFPIKPLCGRLALATIPAFQSASYKIATLQTMQNDRKPSYKHCLTAGATNCRKAYFCWEAALRRVCGISPDCCNEDHGHEEAQKTHKACQKNPDGKIINTYLSGRLMPESFFGYRRRCPRETGTARV